ncbi:LysR family transcriptional regulator [Asanoa ishikariensis]|uniref:DNA-binding transcriptional regulator, LysR family n=1 Tax=Asanoa ishikariensis TaxID=137265 RepID=A0A1H3UDA2_9ACTN|nr:LysR family transcriptional regulator [Asanoa ishikariensis]GIF63792.1 LysR family transcriptional regulator [Asanoa ishikariensis]SDZ60430.1 DNA-binding transcriptional regulator, LysR family [Asanoa ishikariensis]
MELRQLEYFVAVAEEGTFTGGARRVRVAQSAVSATIRKLERELGTALFAREPQATSLTDAGQALLPEARAVLDSAVRARDTVAQARGGLRGTIRMGTLSPIGTREGLAGPLVIDLPAILGRFHATHPLVEFRLRGASSGSASHLADVAAGALDLAMVGTIERPPGVRLHPIGSVRWCFVCAQGHPLADARSVTLDDLRDETFVDFPLGWGNRTMVDRAFAIAGIGRNVPFEAADHGSALGLVRNGLGVAFLPRSAGETPDTSVIEVADVNFDLSIGLATPAHRPQSAATAALIHAVLGAARSSA